MAADCGTTDPRRRARSQSRDPRVARRAAPLADERTKLLHCGTTRGGVLGLELEEERPERPVEARLSLAVDEGEHPRVVRGDVALPRLEPAPEGLDHRSRMKSRDLL